MILLAIINDNQEMIDNALSVLSDMNEDGQKLVFSDLCKKFDSNGDNFISLCFKNSRGNLYVKLIEDMEKVIGEQLIVESFSKTFANHQDILHHALIDNNMEAILSLIKYLKLVNNVTESDKKYISELVVRKDDASCSLLSYAVAKSNYQVSQMILHSAKEFCDSITIKMLINAKDKDGNGPYVVAKLNGDEKLAQLISSFSQEMGIENLISEQMRELEMINQLQSSHIRPLVTQVFT
jgi:ankyrin repeat protein